MSGIKAEITVTKNYQGQDEAKLAVEVTSESRYRDGYKWALRILRAIQDATEAE